MINLRLVFCLPFYDVGYDSRRDFAPKQFDLFAFGFGFKNLCMEYLRNKYLGLSCLARLPLWF